MNKSSITVLIGESNTRLREKLTNYLRQKYKYRIKVATNTQLLQTQLQTVANEVDVVVFNNVMQAESGGEREILALPLTKEIKTSYPSLEIIVYSLQSETAVPELLRAGAYRCLISSIYLDELGMAIQSAVEHRQLKGVDREKQFLEQLMRVSATLLSKQTLSDVLETILRGIQAIGFDRVRLYLLSDDKNYMVGKAQAGMERPFVGLELPVDGDPYLSSLTAESSPILHKREERKSFLYDEILGLEDVNEWVYIPLAWNGELIGFMAADNKFSQNAIPRQSVAPLTLFASPAAAAIQNSRLHDRQEESNRQLAKKDRDLEAIQEVSTTIASTLATENNTLEMICQAVVDLFPDIEHSGLVVFSDEYRRGVVKAEWPPLGMQDVPIPIQGIKAEEDLITTKQPLIITDVPTYEALGTVRDILGEQDIQSVLIVPVLFQEEVIGSFSLDAIGHHRVFTKEEVELCQIFASQMAIAISNAQLFQETRRRAEQLDKIRQTTLVLTSRQDRDILLREIIKQAVDLLGARAGGIETYHPEQGYLEVTADYGHPQTLVGERLEIGEGLAGVLIQMGWPYVIVDSYPEWPSHIPEVAEKAKLGAMITVLLKWQSRIVGVLYLDDEVGRRFTEQDANLLQLFADHAAIVLINAELVEQDVKKQQRLEKLSHAINEIMRNLAGMPRRERLQLITRYATTILGAESCSILLVKEKNLLHLVASYGYETDWVNSGQTFPITSGYKTGLTGYIAHEGILFNAHGDTLHQHIAVKGETASSTTSGQCHSLLVIPIWQHKHEQPQLAGLLRVENKKGKGGAAGSDIGFTQEDEYIIRLFADSVEVVLESTDLVAGLNAQRDRFESLVVSSPNGIIANDDEGRILVFNEKAEATLKYTSEQAIGMNVIKLYAVPEEAIYIGELVRARGLLLDYETLLCSQDEEYIPIRLTATRFNDEHGNVMGVVGYFEDLRLIRQTRERLHFLLAASNMLAQSDNLALGLTSLAEKIVTYLEVSFCRILLLKNNVLVPQATFAQPQLIVAEEAQLQKPIIIADWLRMDELLQAWQYNVIQQNSNRGAILLRQFSSWLGLNVEIQSLLLVPLRTDKVVGLLSLGEVRSQQRYEFSHEKIELALAIANQTAVLIDRLYLHEVTQIAERRLRSAYEASNIPITVQNPQDVWTHVKERMCRIADADSVRIVLVSPITEEVEYIIADHLTEWDKHTIRADGLSLQIVRSGQPEVIEDVNQQRKRIHPLLVKSDIVATVGLPIANDEGQRIGVIWVDYNETHHFFNREIEALQLYANQAAITYDNTRRLKQLEQMRQAAEALADAITLVDVLEQIVTLACQVLQADSAVLWAYDDRRAKFLLKDSVSAGISDEDWGVLRQAEPTPGGRVETIMAQEWLTVKDIKVAEKQNILSKGARTRLTNIGVYSYQAMPLVVSNERLGILFVNYNHSRHFGETDKENALTFVHHAALSLKKARLLQKVNKAGERAGIVANVMTLAKLEDTLFSVASGVKDVLDCDVVTLYAYDVRKQRLFLAPTVVGANFPEKIHPTTELTDNSPVYYIMQQPGTHHIADNVQSDSWFKDSRFAQDEEIASCLAVSLGMSDKTMGVIFINYRTPHRFTGDELDTVELFANQTAVAIHNAQLYNQQQKHLSALEAIETAGQVITGTLDLEEILARLVEQVWHLVSYEDRQVSYAGIWLVEQEPKARLVATYPPEEIFTTQTTLGAEVDFQVGQDGQNGRVGIMGRVIKTGEPALVEDVSQDPDYLISHLETQSELVVPIKLGDEEVGVIGVINVQHPTRAAFDDEDRRALQSLAAQAAVAIQNAQLYDQVRRQVDNLKALHVAARTVTTSLNLEETFFAIAEQACKLTGTHGTQAQFSHLAQLEGAELTFRATYPRTHLQELYQQVGTIHIEWNKRIGIVGRAVKDRRPVLVKKVRPSHSDYIDLNKDTQSELAVPILSDKRVIGAINVEHPSPNAFDEQDVRILQTLAEYASIAIQNAQLYKWLETVGSISSEAATSLDIPRLLRTVCERLEANARASTTASIRLYSAEQNCLIFDPDWHKSLYNRIDMEGEEGRTSQPLDLGICGWVATHKRPLNVGDVTAANASPKALRLISSTRSELCVPILYGEEQELIGVLHMQSSEINAFDDSDQRFLETLAGQLATAIKKAQTYNELKDVKGLVGARTALAWMGMASSTWRHNIEGKALSIRTQVDLLERILAKMTMDKAHINKVRVKLTNIKEMANIILDRPITPPLDIEKGTVEILINDWLYERIGQLWQNDPYRQIDTPHFDLQATVDYCVRISPEWLRQAFDLLVDNAIRAIQEVDTPQLHIHTLTKGSNIEIHIRDNGLGIPPHVQTQLFKEPIKDSDGLGMGLLMVQAIIQTYHGDVYLGETGPSGTTMIISLPQSLGRE